MPENVSRLTKIQYQGGGYHVCGATDSLKHSPDSANGRSAFAQCAKRFSDPVWDLKIPKWNVVVRRRYGYRFSVGPPLSIRPPRLSSKGLTQSPASTRHSRPWTGLRNRGQPNAQTRYLRRGCRKSPGLSSTEEVLGSANSLTEEPSRSKCDLRCSYPHMLTC